MRARGWFAFPAALTLAVVVAVLAGSSAAAPAPPTAAASVTGGPQFVDDQAGVVFTFAVRNTGTTPIAAVDIYRPSTKWRVEQCLQMPAGWTPENGADRCRFRSQKVTTDDIPAGQVATFSLRVTTDDGNADRAGSWDVRVARTESFDGVTQATPEGAGLSATTYSFELLDAVVVAAPPAPGSPCPAPNRQAIGGSTVKIAICGKNRTNGKLTPTAAQSSLAGTFVGSVGGPFTSGQINAHSGNVVLGNWAGVQVTGTGGTGKTIVAKTGASATATSPLTTLGGYGVTVVNVAPTAAAASTTTLEDTPATLPLSGSDADGNNLTFALSTPAAKGSTSITGLSCNALTPRTCTATLNYTPLANANGSDPFAYTANDGTVNSAPASLSVAITPVNDEPSFNLPASPTQTANEDSGAHTVNGFATGIAAGPANESGQTVTFHVSNGNNALFSAQPAIDPATGNLTYTPAANAFGSALVSVFLTDDGGTANSGDDTSTTKAFNVTVTPVNDLPSFNLPASPDQTQLEDSGAHTVGGFATAISAGPANESGQTLTFHVSNNNNALFSAQPDIDEATGNLTYTSAPNANGSATVTVTLSDNGGGADTSAQQTFQIAVTAVNDAPSFSVPPAAPAVNEDAGTVVVPAFATAISRGPGNESGQTLAFQVVANTNPSLFTPMTGLPFLDAATGNLSYSPAANAVGSAAITVKLMDGGGTANGGLDTSGNQVFTITVNPVNDAPSFTLPASPSQTALEDSGAHTVGGFATAISAGPANESGQALTFQVSNDGNGLFSVHPDIDEATGNLTYTPAPNANGSATVTVTLSDSGGGADTSAAKTFTITVTAVNDEPSFSLPASPDQSVTQSSGLHTVNGFATSISAGPADESAQVLTFHVSNDNGALFSAQPAINAGTGTLTYTLATGTTGSATVSVFLTDNGGTANGGDDTSATKFFTITVNPIVNVAPVAQGQTGAGGVTVIEDTVKQITLSATDANGDALTFSIEGPPAKGTLGNFGPVNCSGTPSTCTRTVDYTPSPNVTGNDGFVFRANDGQVNSGQSVVEIVITPVNDPPSFTKGPDQTALEDSGVHTDSGWPVAVSAGPANESGQSVTVEVTGNTNPGLFAVAPAFDSGANLTFTPAPDAVGSATITVRARDDGGTALGGVDVSATQTFVIDVTPVNDPPTFTPGLGQTFDEDSGPHTISPWATGISAGPANESGQTVHFEIASNTAPGLFSAGPTVSATGALSFTPAPDRNGTASIGVRLVDDGGAANGGSDTILAPLVNIQINPVNDAPSFTKGPDLANLANQNAGGSARAYTVNGWATAISKGPANESGQAVDFVIDSVTPSNLFTVQPAVSPAGNLTFTTDPANAGTATVVLHIHDDGGTANGGVNASATQSFTIQTFSPLPVAVDDAYTATGNISIDVNTAAEGVLQRGTDDTLMGSAITNCGPTNAAATAVSGATCTTTSSSGGSVVLKTDGTFTYEPAAGFTGADHFFYRLTNGSGSDVGDVTVTVSDMVWFVNNAAASAGDGRLAHPFDTLAAFRAVNGQSGLNPKENQSIFLYTGSGAYTDGVVLLSGQRLYGQGMSASFSTIATLAPFSAAAPSTGGTPPSLTTAGSGVSAIYTSTGNNTIRGLDIGNRSAWAIESPGGGASFGTLTVSEVNVTGSGSALLLSRGTVNASFGTLSSSSGSYGLFLRALDGTISATGGTLTDHATSVLVNFGTVSLTYPGAITHAGAGGFAVFATSTSGGTLTFSGPITDSTGVGGGVYLDNNAGATFTFSGDVRLSTGVNNAFRAMNGGTVNVTGSNNALATTTGTALDVQNTTIGASGLTFKSIFSNGAANGIVLNTTGSSGGLTVTGNGGSCTSAATCTGGAIRSSTGAGVSLTNVGGGVSLTRMSINDGLDDGIRASGVGTSAGSGIALASSVVSANGNAAGEHGLDWDEVHGVTSITGTTVSGSAQNDARIHAVTGTLRLTVDGSTFSNSTAVVGSEDFLLDEQTTAVVRARFSGNIFTSNRPFTFFSNATNDASVDLTFEDNAFHGTGATTSRSGMSVQAAHTTDVRVSWDGDVIDGVGPDGEAIWLSSSQTASLDATVGGLTVTPGGVDVAKVGILALPSGDSAMRVAIRGGNVRAAESGINLANTGGIGASDFTVTGTTVVGPALFPIYVQSTQTNSTCADIGGSTPALENTFAGQASAGSSDIGFNRGATAHLFLPGFDGNAANLTAYIQNRNVGAPTLVNQASALEAGPAACQQPTAPTLP